MKKQTPFWPGHSKAEKMSSSDIEKIHKEKKTISLNVILFFILLFIIGIIVLYFIFRS